MRINEALRNVDDEECRKGEEYLNRVGSADDPTRSALRQSDSYLKKHGGRRSMEPVARGARAFESAQLERLAGDDSSISAKYLSGRGF